MALKDIDVVVLAPEQRQLLERMTWTGTPAARALPHARSFFMPHVGPDGDADPDDAITEAVGVHPGTEPRVRRLFVGSGADATLKRKPPTGRQYRRFDREQEARLVALATVHSTLKITEIKPWLKPQWGIPQGCFILPGVQAQGLSPCEDGTGVLQTAVRLR